MIQKFLSFFRSYFIRIDLRNNICRWCGQHPVLREIIWDQVYVVICTFKWWVSHISHQIWKHCMNIFAFFWPAHYVRTGEMMPEVVCSRLDLSIAFQSGRQPDIPEVRWNGWGRIYAAISAWKEVFPVRKHPGVCMISGRSTGTDTKRIEYCLQKLT